MVEIDVLLEKNPDVKEVFEKNQTMLANTPRAKKSQYRLGFPYGDCRPISDSQDNIPMPNTGYINSYQTDLDT